LLGCLERDSRRWTLSVRTCKTFPSLLFPSWFSAKTRKW
jgi:hypothetical protein